MIDAPVRPGDIVADKYRVDRILGAGGMGVVVAATHLGLAQTVALKFMLPGKLAQQEQGARFLREARASVRLKSQHVARVLDVAVLDGGPPYLVMEFLDGRDLATVLEARGPLPVSEAVEYVLQACEAVAEAHAAGIVHRDLKPANLFLTTGPGGAPCVKVIDFGVSKHVDSNLALTDDTRALGSPLYMSPEQMNSSRDVDGRSDLWSLGVILYELVAGHPPFQADTVAQLCTRVFFATPPPLASLRPDVPAGFEAILLQCLEKDRARRFADVAELAAALAPYATPRAALYAERVASVLGVPVQPARSTDLLPPEPGVPPFVAGGTASATTSATTAVAMTNDAPASTPASRPEIADIQPFGSAVTAPLATPAAPREPSGARTRGLLVTLAVFAVAAPLAVFLAMRGRGSVEGSTADPSADPSTAASRAVFSGSSSRAPEGAPEASEPTVAPAANAARETNAASASPEIERPASPAVPSMNASTAGGAIPRAKAPPAAGSAPPPKDRRPSYEGPRR